MARPSRSADAQAPIRERDAAADEHDQRAEPDEANERIEVSSDRITAFGLAVADNEVEIAAPGCVNPGLRRRLRRGVVEALRWRETRDSHPIALHVEVGN